MLFFTADLHFGHPAILRHCDRPFSSIEEMDTALINNWNAVVTNKDIVYHIGDFAWKNADEYLKQLNGNVVFILGNHDKAIQAGQQSRKQIVKSHIHSITVKNDEDGSKQHIVLCHYAMRSWDRSHYGTWMCFGHTHGRGSSYGKSYDVGVDNNGYFPVSYSQLQKIMEMLPLEKIETQIHS
jgi:calcineurin-like phosphoesterase family protein